ncbi:MAG: suppressor of fused domain protein [Actinomycetota bacterium]|nr:suppressor of fused domain protein [Actinomycetota bacterium]
MSGVAPPSSRGGAAIQLHVEAVDGPAEQWFHPRPSRAFSGAGPVEAVALHRLGQPDHWHLVTYGLSELHAKESPDRHRSGWGFELTIRIATDPDGERPLWAVDFLASLAAYVWSGRHPFAAGHLMDLRGPIRMDRDSPISAALVVDDPVLDPLAGPYGSVEFLQVVGLTAEELELCRAWSTEGVADVLARAVGPLLLTDVGRASVVADPRFAAEIEARAAREGSELHELRIATLRIRRRLRGRVDVHLGSGAAAALGPALRRELVADGASFAVVGDDSELRFQIGPEPSWKLTGDGVQATVAADGVEYVAGLFDGRTGWGRASDWPGLRFRVVP